MRAPWLLSSMLFASCAARGATAPSGDLVARHGHATLSCARDRPVAPRVLGTPSACEADSMCRDRGARAIAEGRRWVVVSPSELGQRFTFDGPPTTTGSEWTIHRGIPVRCDVDAKRVTAAAVPDAGGGSVVYAVEVAATASVGMCRCGD